MARGTKIEWATATWNPFIGCTKISPACDNCYAESWAKRCGRDFGHISRAAYATLCAPLKWKKPERIFVCSLSDFFHPLASPGDRAAAISIMRQTPQHTYMLLTKRPQYIKEQLAITPWHGALPDNVWLGVTAENQEQADRRIPYLLQVPAQVNFVSCEPLLGPISLEQYMVEKSYMGGAVNYLKLSWVICGGESGAHARPMHPEWARSLRDQCAAAGVPFMFKQWGEWYPDNKGIYEGVRSAILGDVAVHRVGKANAGRLLDGKEHLAVPA